jgi:ferredoxin-NADP reductase
MAQTLAAQGIVFELRYAGRNQVQMAFKDKLQRELGEQFHAYYSDENNRLDIEKCLLNAPVDSNIYVYGP